MRGSFKTRTHFFYGAYCGGRIPLPPDGVTVRQGVTFRVRNKAVSVRVLSNNAGKDKAGAVRVLR